MSFSFKTNQIMINNSKVFKNPSPILQPFKDGWMPCTVCKKNLVPKPSWWGQMKIQGTGKIIIPCRDCQKKAEYENKIKQKEQAMSAPQPIGATNG